MALKRINPESIPVKVSINGTEWIVIYNESTGNIERFLLGDSIEFVENKATDFSVINDIKYPTTKAVNDQKGIPNGIASLDLNGKLTPSQIPDIAITKVVVATETNITDFAANSGNYTFEQGDVILIDDLGDVKHYLFIGGDKTDVNEYSLINASEITISQVIGLQSELDGKASLTNNQTFTGNNTFTGAIINLNTTNTNVTGLFNVENIYARVKFSSANFVYFGDMSRPSSSGFQNYGAYVGHNAYRAANGDWLHGREDTIGASIFTVGGNVSSGMQGFNWCHSANSGSSPISFTNLMELSTQGVLGTRNIVIDPLATNTNIANSILTVKNQSEGSSTNVTQFIDVIRNNISDTGAVETSGLVSRVTNTSDNENDGIYGSQLISRNTGDGNIGFVYGTTNVADHSGGGSVDFLVSTVNRANITGAETTTVDLFRGVSPTVTLNNPNAIVNFMQSMHPNLTFNAGTVNNDAAVMYLDIDYDGSGVQINGSLAYIVAEGGSLPPATGGTYFIKSTVTHPSEFAGSIQAPSFIGDGSQLTGLDIKQVYDTQTTTFNSGGTSNENYYTYNMPANTLKIGDIVEVNINGRIANPAGTNIITIGISGAVLSKSFTNSSFTSFDVNMRLVVTSATTFKVVNSVNVFTNSSGISNNERSRTVANSGVGFDITSPMQVLGDLTTTTSGSMIIDMVTTEVKKF